jgi:histidinol-phosphate aminotransferase
MSPAEPRSGLRDVEPYQAPQLDVPFRLNTNECPYPLPDGFADDLADAVRTLELNRYPDREAAALREGLATHAGHAFEGTWAANGSNEIIQQLLLAYGGPGRSAFAFTPTYELHSRLSWVTHTDVAASPLTPPFVIGDAQIAAAEAARPNVVFVCSPNNPTGNTQPLDTVLRLADARGGETLVVVDEAYIEFGGESALGLVASNPNVVIVRTFSKAFALAGARIGYCLADPAVIDDVRRVRLPYHLSALTQAAGITGLKYSKEALSILAAIREQRDRILEELPAVAGVEVYPSHANFVLFRPAGDVTATWKGLLEEGVLVRDVSNNVPGCLRVTAGTPEETGAFLSAMKEVTSK